MSRKRVFTAILVATIAICLVRISRIGHESDPPVPGWWGWPLTLWAHLLNVLRSVLHLGVMALPVAAVVYLVGRVNGLWAGPLRRGRAALTGALAAVVGLLPASILLGLFSGIMVPFRGPVSGLEAAWRAPIVVLFYGMLGGFPVVALLGALGGAAVYAAMPRGQQSPDRPDGRATAFLIMSIFTIFTILIDYGCLEYVESRSWAGVGVPVAMTVTGRFLAIFLVITLLWSSGAYIRARQARRGRPFPIGTFIFCSCLFLGLVLGVALGEVAGFVALGLIVGAVAGGIRGAMSPPSHSTKALGSPPPAGVGDRDLDRLS